MPVTIDDEYRAKVSRIMKRNMESGKLSGIFSTLSKWRQPMPEKDKFALMRIHAQHMQMAERREEIKKIWQKILTDMPIPRYMN